MPGSVAGNDGVGHGLIVLAMLADEAGTRSLHTRVCAGAGLGGEVRLPAVQGCLSKEMAEEEVA